jgi:hypothetical protein
MKVQNFISKMNREGGLARSNRYKVTIIPPSIMGAVRSIGSFISNPIGTAISKLDQNRYYAAFQVDPISVTQNLEFFCFDTQLPGLNYQTTETRTYGTPWKDPYEIGVEDVTMSFYCSNNMKEKYFFDAWTYAMKDPVTNDHYYNREYSTQIIIQTFSETGESNYGVRLVDAYPTSVYSTKVSYSQPDEPLKMHVNLTYKNWYNLKAYDTVVSSVGQVINDIIG